jgi:hypothetical protein
MEIKKKALLTTATIRPKKREERETMKTQSISTTDLGNDRKIRRDFVLSQATEEELDELWEKIEPRLKFESEIIILKCSLPTCDYYERNRRRAISTPCPQCSKKAYFVEGESPESGKLEQASAKEIEAILAKEKAEAEVRGKAERERIEARKILSKAGIIP